MADNIRVAPSANGTDPLVATETVTLQAVVCQVALGKVGFGAADTYTGVALATGLPVQPGTATTWAVTAAALPLPAGAALVASVVTMSAKLPAALGQAASAASLAVVLPAAQITTLTPPAAIVGFALDTTVSAASAKLPATLGQKAMVASLAVTLASDQSTIPVSNASLPLPTGASTESTLASLSGKVTAVNTGAVVISGALPAGTAVVGVAIAPQQTGALYSGTTSLTPKFATIVASASGATTVIAAVATKKIRVLKLTLSASAAVNVKYQSHALATDLTGLLYLAANSGLGMGFCPLGHFETLAGEALDINLSAAIAVGGVITYVEV